MIFQGGWEWKIIPTDVHSMIFQRGRWLNHQPEEMLWQSRPLHKDQWLMSNNAIRAEAWWQETSEQDEGQRWNHSDQATR